jgi:hypothetical protein
MAQSTILAAGITEATSTDIVIAAGASVVVGVFFLDADKPLSYQEQNAPKFKILQDTPGADNAVFVALSYSNPSTVLSGPGTYRVKRYAYVGKPFGVFLET